MQIRKSANKLLCIRNVYNKELGRGKATTIASFERYGSDADSDTVCRQDGFGNLTESEQQQLIDYLKNHENDLQNYKHEKSSRDLIAQLEVSISALNAGIEVKEADAIAIYQLMDEYTKLLKKQGFTKREMLAKGSN